MTTLHINGRAQQVDLPDETPLLWALRDELGHTGTKFGCGMALCGACTVHLNGQAIRSCITPISAAEGQKLSTIEAVQATATHFRLKTYKENGAYHQMEHAPERLSVSP